MANEIKYPEGKFKIVNVGPNREWSFKGDNGEDIKMVSYSIQFENVAEWVDVSQKPDSPAPKEGEELEGHIEDTGKYGFKFVKKRGSGGWGGKKNYAGAHYNSAVSVAAQIVVGYYQVKGEKPTDINEMMDRIEQLSPRVKTMVDKFAGTESKSEDSSTDGEKSEEKSADSKQVTIEDVDEKELSW